MQGNGKTGRSSWEEAQRQGKTREEYELENFEVKEIGAIKYTRRDRFVFYVKWEHPHDHPSKDSWEPLKSFENTPEPLIVFKNRYPALPVPPPLDADEENRSPPPPLTRPSLADALKNKMTLNEYQNQTYRVKSVMGLSFLNGKPEFEVSWKDQDKDFRSTEPLEAMAYELNALKTFYDWFPDIPEPSSDEDEDEEQEVADDDEDDEGDEDIDDDDDGIEDNNVDKPSDVLPEEDGEQEKLTVRQHAKVHRMRRTCIICGAMGSNRRAHCYNPLKKLLFIMPFSEQIDIESFLTGHGIKYSCRNHTVESLNWWKQQPNDLGAISVGLSNGDNIYVNNALQQEIDRYGFDWNTDSVISAFRFEHDLLKRYHTARKDQNGESLDKRPLHPNVNTPRRNQGASVLQRRTCCVCGVITNTYRAIPCSKTGRLMLLLSSNVQNDISYLMNNNSATNVACQAHHEYSDNFWKQQSNEQGAISVALFDGTTIYLNKAVQQEFARFGLALNTHEIRKAFQRMEEYLKQLKADIPETQNGGSPDQQRPTDANTGSLRLDQDVPHTIEPTSPEKRVIADELPMMDIDDVDVPPPDNNVAPQQVHSDDAVPLNANKRKGRNEHPADVLIKKRRKHVEQAKNSQIDIQEPPAPSPVNMAEEQRNLNQYIHIGEQYTLVLPARQAKLQLVLGPEQQLILQHIGADGGLIQEHNIDLNTPPQPPPRNNAGEPEKHLLLGELFTAPLEYGGIGRFRMMPVLGNNPMAQFIEPVATNEDLFVPLSSQDDIGDFPAIAQNEPNSPEPSRTLDAASDTLSQIALDKEYEDHTEEEQEDEEYEEEYEEYEDYAEDDQDDDQAMDPEEERQDELDAEERHPAVQQAPVANGEQENAPPPRRGFVLNEVLEDDGDDYVQYVGRMTDEIRIQRIERGERVYDMRAIPNPYWTGEKKVWYPSVKKNHGGENNAEVKVEVKEEDPDEGYEVQQPKPKTKKKNKKSKTKKSKEDPHGEFPGYKEHSDSETDDEVIRNTIKEWCTTEAYLENRLSEIARNPTRLGICDFCGRHYASILCQKYPKHSDRLGVTKRNGGCLSCGGMDHKSNRSEKCRETELCLGCGNNGHYLTMCPVFKTDAIVNKYTLLRCSHLPLEAPNRTRRRRGRGHLNPRRGGR